MASARHVIGCHSTPETRVHNALDDGASTIHHSLMDSAHPVTLMDSARPVIRRIVNH